MIDTKFLLLVPVLSLIGSGSYIYDVVRGKVQPNRVTWALWSLAPLIAFAAEIHAGVGLQSLLTFMAGFGPLLTLIATYISRKAVWKLTRFDFVCGSLSLLGLLLWFVTRQGNVAIIFAIMADALAALPTLKKSFLKPESESSFVFATGVASGVLSLLTIDDWTLANAAFSTYIMLICLVFVLLVRFKLGVRLSMLFRK